MHKKQKQTRFWPLSITGLSMLLVSVLVWSGSTNAQSTNPDPYADSVSDSSAAVVDPNNATGAPNGTNATVAGVGAQITLDMGVHEEGTHTLKVHFGVINAQVNINVSFLDANKATILSTDRQLGAEVNPTQQNFGYDWTNFGKAYRFVKISTEAGTGVNVDAIEALGYLGSTPSQDTDGDGTSDRSEQQQGTNPLDPSSKPTPPPPPPGTPPAPDTDGGSGQVNPPPAPGNDNDGDGISNDFETQHGLNPDDKTDATDDSDNDGLNNKQEYQLGSDPTKSDTDGDRLPDKWEFDQGTDILVYDADEDPDFDTLTNIGEYRNGTDPLKGDNLIDVFCKEAVDEVTKVVTSNPWIWIVIAFLLGGLVGWMGRPHPHEKKPQQKTTEKITTKK